MARCRSLALTLVAAGVAALVAGCGSASTSKSGASVTSTTLRVPFLADMSVPDPDVFYDIEGNSVILAAYQGLVKYAPDSTTIVGDLATSFSTSPDGLTYTFQLKPGIKFHDGTPFTSASVKASFARRLRVNQAPAYMLAQVKQVLTPDPITLIVKLKVRVAPFLHYLASSWGPKMIGPAALVQNAGSDAGQSYLRTHDDGTGPYQLTGFARGSQYTLSAFPGYSGTKPHFQQVLIKIIPNIGTQQLELKNGSLDAILHSYPASQLGSVGSGLKVRPEKSFLRALLYINTNKAPFSDPAVRAALAKSIDVRKLVSEAYGGTGTVPTGPYPLGILTNQPPLDYGQSAPTPQKAKGGPITLAYTADESGVQKRVSELLQSELSTIGYQVTLQEVQLPQVYNYLKDLKSAPDLLLQTNTPDAAHPDPWARILWGSTGGLNFLGFKDTTMDKLLDQAQSSPAGPADALYRQIGQRLVASHEILFLADVKDTIVERQNLTGGTHVPAYPWMLDFASLARG